jgi:hypothetical protein
MYRTKKMFQTTNQYIIHQAKWACELNQTLGLEKPESWKTPDSV